MDVTQEAILSLLREAEGKLKNSDLLSKFKGPLNCADPAEKKQNRDLFKRIVNTVAVVKEIEDVKYIVIRKKFLHLLQEGHDVVHQVNNRSETPEPGEQSSPVQECDHNAHSQEGRGETSVPDNQEPVVSSVSECVLKDSEAQPPTEDVRSPIELALQRFVDFKPKRALFFNVDQPSEVCALKSKTPVVHNKPYALPLRMPPNPTRIETRKLKSGDDDDPPARVNSYQDPYSSPRVKRRQLNEGAGPGTPQLRGATKTTKPSEEPKFPSSVPLEQAEHEWLVRSASGHWTQVLGLLLRDNQLAEKRDFMSGFTALHWAAKTGNSEMVARIIDISRKAGVEVDVNARTYGGYTPLHIAALHDQEFVLAMLVNDYGADANRRDNCGKKPYYYLHKGISPRVRELLGEPKVEVQEPVPQEKEDLDLFPELSKGFHTISRLFQPHVAGHKKKHKQRAGFLSLNDDPRDDGEESGSRHSLLSDIFM